MYFVDRRFRAIGFGFRGRLAPGNVVLFFTKVKGLRSDVARV